MIYVPVEKKPFDPICVAIDYDETISLNEVGWMRIIKAFQNEGFKVIVVTYRPPECDPWELGWFSKGGIPVHFTSGKAKRKFMHDLGVRVDIWIDDMPETVCLDRDKVKDFPFP